MKLLIVDDQFHVASGLKTGIDWKQLGFTAVYSALSALEARHIISQQGINVLLCDIEMPQENGLSLIKWLRSEKYDIKVILLTSHARFEYAKEAIQMDCFDYIVQPAPYDMIFSTVGRAVDSIREESSKEELSQYGTILQKQQSQLARNTLWNYIQGNYKQQQLDALTSLSLFPQGGQAVYLGIFQIITWKQLTEWEPVLLTDTLDNIGAEIFQSFQLKFIITPADKTHFVFMVWNNQEETSRDYIEHQLQFFNSITRQFLCCESAVYFDGPVTVEETSACWQSLIALKNQNILSDSRVFRQNRQMKMDYIYNHEEVRYWAEYLKNGMFDQVRKKSAEFLDGLVKSGMLSANVLTRIYQDFLQSAYYAAEISGCHLCDFFTSESEMDLYLGGMKSLDQMKALIFHIIDCFEQRSRQMEQSDLISKVRSYVSMHMEKELRRDELAEYAGVSPDYLTRRFKKETGESVKEYVIRIKMEEAQNLLQSTQLPVSIIAAMVGYDNFSHFSQTYKKLYGITPSQEREGKE